MKIPSPRTFIEIGAFFWFTLCVAVGMIGSGLMLAAFNAIEKAVDGARNWRKGRSA